EADVVFRICRPPWGHVGKLRKEPGQLGPPDGLEARPDTIVENRPQSVYPRTVRQGLFGHVAAADENAPPSLHRLARHLRNQPALTDPRLAQPRDQLSPPPGRLVQRGEETRALPLTPDDLRLARQ